MGKKLTLKQIGTNITREVAKGVTQLANSAAHHGNQDLADALRPAANALTAAHVHGNEDMLKIKNEFGDIEKIINAQSAAIEQYAAQATAQTKEVLADCLKLEGEIKDLESLELSTDNADVKSQLDNKKRDEVIALSKAVTDIQPVKTADQNAVSDKNPVHLRGIISNAPEKSKSKNGLEDPKRAMDIANSALASLKTLAKETKKAFEDSNAALTKLMPEIEALKKEIAAKRDAIQAALAAAKKEKEAAELKAKREAEEKAKKTAEIQKKMAALQAELEALNPNASVSVSAASSSVAPKQVTPALNAAQKNNNASSANSAAAVQEGVADRHNDSDEGQPGASAALAPAASKATAAAHK